MTPPLGGVTTVQISERSAGADGSFGALLVVGEGGGQYEIEVSSPFSAAEEAELEWYFEKHLEYPFLDTDRERAAVRRIAEYGTALFGQVFGGGDAGHEYRQLKARAFDRCRVEVLGSAGFHRL